MRQKRGSRGYRALIGVLLVALMLLAAGCNSLGTSNEEDAGVSGIAPDAAVSSSPGVAEERAAGDVVQSVPSEQYGTGADASTVPPADRLVVRTAGLRLDVEDVEASVGEVRAKAEEVGGMVTDVQVSTDVDVPVYRYDAQGTLSDGAALSGWVTVRVPADAYEGFMESVRELGDVVRQSESESDVTQQHIDLQAQLDNLKAQEQRLREFFDQATTVEDLLAIEQELTRVRAEIDSYEAQIAFLERQAAMSTVTIELLGPRPVVSPEGESWGFVEAITTGIRGAAGVLRFGISFVIASAPLWLAGIVIFLVVRAVLRRRRPTHAEEPAE